MSTIKLRRDTADNWLAANPVLALAEPGLETDTNKVKYGDGVNTWSALSYGGSGSNLPTTAAGVLVNNGSGTLSWSTSYVTGTPWRDEGYLASDGTGLIYGSRLVFVNGNGSDLLFQTGQTGWGKVTANNSEGFGLKSDLDVAIRASDKHWAFGTDGTLTLPTSSAITTTPGYVATELTINGFTSGTNTQLTVYSHPFTSGDKALVGGLVQPTDLNDNIYYVRSDDADHITLFTDHGLTQGVDSTGFAPYTYNSARTMANVSVTYNTDSPYVIIQGMDSLPNGGSMSFDGTTSLLQVKNDPVFAPASTTPWTVEFWAKYTATLVPGQTVFSIGAAANPMFALRVGSGGYWEIVLNGVGWSTGTSPNGNYGPFGSNVWRHVAIVSDGAGTLSVFYSGNRFAIETPVSFTYNFAQTFSIGGSSPNSTFGYGPAEAGSNFSGLITDFRFVVGTAVYDPTIGILVEPTAPVGTTPSVTELYIPATDSSHFAQDTTTTETHTGGGHVAKEFASADLLLEVGAVTTEDPGHVVLKSGSNQLKFGGADGGVTFPDATVQTTAWPGLASVGVGPLTPWGSAYPSSGYVYGTDYQFYFDSGNNGYPTMKSYAPAGGNPLYNTVWNVEYWIDSLSSSNPASSSSGATPVQVNNTGGTTLIPHTITPGDYAVVRIQNLDTGKVYRATFLGSYKAADTGNETHYGSIIVERLL